MSELTREEKGEFGLSIEKQFDGNDMLLFARFYYLYIQDKDKFWIYREFERLLKLKNEGKLRFVHCPPYESIQNARGQEERLIYWLSVVCPNDENRIRYELSLRGYSSSDRDIKHIKSKFPEPPSNKVGGGE